MAGFVWLVGSTDESGLPELRIGRTAQPVTDWLLVGPLAAQQDWPSAAKGTKWKADAEMNERDLAAMTPGTAVARTAGFVNRMVRGEDFLRLSDWRVPDLQPPAAPDSESKRNAAPVEAKAYYAACTLRCLRASTRYLMLASDSPVKIYLNGRLVGERTEARMFRKWDNGYPLHLQRGRNLLLVKITETPEGLGSVAMRIEPDVIAATQTALDHGGLIVSSLIVDPEKRATFQIKGAPTHDALTGELINSDGVRIRKFDYAGNRAVELGLSGDAQPSGLCRIRLRLEEKAYEKYICFGDPDAVAAEIFARLQAFHADSRTTDNIDALRWRWRVLTSAKNRSPKDREWQAKIVSTLGELQEIVTSLTRSSEPRADVSGLHIRAFRSRVDGQVEHYRAYIPRRDGSAPGRMPLLIMLPTPVQVPRPFIESVFIARHLEAEEMALLAGRMGAALLWSGYRTSPNGTPWELAHLDAAIAEMCRTCAIDTGRIYLLGSCAGSVFAMQAALEWPDRFAGVGLLNPAFRLPQIHPDNWAVIDVPEYAAWRKANDPVTRFIRSSKLPMRVVHDGDVEPGHGELEESVSFVREAEAGGRAIEFVQMAAYPATHFHTEGWSRVIDGLLSRKNAHFSQAVDPAEIASLGPLRAAFGESFVVVQGTGGNEAEKVRIDQVTKAFQKAWRGLNSSDCRVIADTALDATQRDNVNLVLVGNAETNSVWGRFGSLGVTLKRDEVLIGEERVPGEALSVQAVVRHPSNAARRIVLVGAADAASMRFGTLELSEVGWFDYAVWRSEGDGATLVAARSASTPAYPAGPKS